MNTSIAKAPQNLDLNPDKIEEENFLRLMAGWL